MPIRILFLVTLMVAFGFYTAQFVGYGWGDPGETIFAGQRPNIPEPGSLGLLAFGAIGLMAWRKNRILGPR